jgi:HEAT repeat protein
VIFGLSQMHSQRAKEKLFEIARTSDDRVVRREAIFWIGQDHSGGADFLVQLYDGEQDADTKKKIIFSLNQTGSKKGIRKLMDIAKADANVQLRKEAMFWLGQSNDPEARKFVEDILK